MKRSIVAIATTILGRTHYVKSETQLANGEISPELTTQTDQIKEYDDHDCAAGILRNIRDSFKREYRVESVWCGTRKSLLRRSRVTCIEQRSYQLNFYICKKQSSR